MWKQGETEEIKETPPGDPRAISWVYLSITASRNTCGLRGGWGGQRAQEGLKHQREGTGKGSPGQRFPGCYGGHAAPVCWWPVHASGSLEHPVALESETEAK